MVGVIGVAQVQVGGIVVDTLGNPILSVSVFEEGTSNSTVTDRKGNFSMRTQFSRGNLLFRSIGHLDARYQFDSLTSSMRIEMKPSKAEIEAVIVSTGYQQIPKDRATGSFVQLSNETLDQRVASNLLERIEGYMPSLQFETRSGNKEIHVRGLSTFNRSMSAPLVIVDNFPYEGNLDNINPNDVESVTLLRDAAATSIWGARAGNGVLVINRKKGTQTPLTWQYRSNIRISQKPRIMEIPVMSGRDFMDVEKVLFDQGFYDNLLDPSTNRYTILSPFVMLLDEHRQGNVTLDEIDGYIRQSSGHDYRNDLNRHLYRHPVLNQHSIGLSGGNERSSYRSSLGYDHSLADRVLHDNSRISLSQHFNYRMTRSLHLDLSLNLISSQTRSNPQGERYPVIPGGGRVALYPYARLISEGEYMPIPRGYNSAYLNSIWNENLMDWTYSPLAEIDKATTSARMTHSHITAGLRYDIKDWLKVDVLYGFESQLQRGRSIYGEDSYYTRDLVNLFTQVDQGVYEYPIPRGGILDASNGYIDSHRGRAMLSVDKTWNGMHNLVAIAGGEVSGSKTETNSSREYGLDSRILQVKAIDYVSTFLTFDGLGGRQRIYNSSGLGELNQRFVSVFSNMSYTFDRRYTVSASVRRDASNIFGVQTNQRWNPLWSAGLSYNIGNEEFMGALSWVDHLRIRSTYGHSGNAGGVSSTHPILRYVSPSNLWLENYPRAQVTELPNPSLKWEDVAMFNMGLDLAFWGGMLGGSVEYFSKTSNDLLSNDIIDPTLGFSTAKRNVGRMKGRGFDMEVYSRIGGNRFSWRGSLNLSKNTSEIVSYQGSPSNASYYTSNTGTSLNPLEGKSPYPVFAYRFAGLDPYTGNPMGYMDDVTSEDYSALLTDTVSNLRYYGTSMAPYFGSFDNSFQWKNLTFSFLITYKFGHYKQKETIQYASLFNSWLTHADFSKRWVSPGDEMHTTVPSMVYPASTNRDQFYAQSEPNIYTASYIRLQDIRVSYQLPLHIRQRKGVMGIMLNVNQLGLIWKANNDGIDSENYPLPIGRNYSIGISLKY